MSYRPDHSTKPTTEDQPLTHGPETATEEEVLQFLRTGNEDGAEVIEIGEPNFGSSMPLVQSPDGADKEAASDSTPQAKRC